MVANSSAKFVPAKSMNTAIIHCDAGAKGSIERGSVEKPPVPIVVNEWATALNRVMRSSIGSTQARQRGDLGEGERYVEDDEASRGLADRVLKPDLRARHLVLDQGLAAADAHPGSTARNSTMMPRPPSQTVNWRHIAIDRERPRRR